MNYVKIINEIKIKKWKKNGLIVGENFSLQKGAQIDSAFPWLITIGNKVTIAPDTLILSHDGSTKNVTGYTKVGCVEISDNVFIGAKSIILPNTTIGKNCIIGACSVVSGNIPDDMVVCGNPAKIICSVTEFKNKHEKNMLEAKKYDKSYTRKGKITDNKKKEMKKNLKNKIGYIE